MIGAQLARGRAHLSTPSLTIGAGFHWPRAATEVDPGPGPSPEPSDGLVVFDLTPNRMKNPAYADTAIDLRRRR